MPRQAIHAPGAVTVGPYSPAVSFNGLYFFSGQTPVDPETGGPVTGSIAAQVEQCLRQLMDLAQAAGLGQEDILKVSVFLTDMADFPEMNATYARFFESPYPARTTIAVVGLPRGAQVEIEMIAGKSAPGAPTEATVPPG